jgi:hypothetical protein
MASPRRLQKCSQRLPVIPSFTYKRVLPFRLVVFWGEWRDDEITKKTPAQRVGAFILISIEENYFRLRAEARMNSRFIRAMFSTETSFGQAASHSPSLVQCPKPSSSI